MSGAGRRRSRLADLALGVPLAGLAGVALVRASGTTACRQAVGVQAFARWALLPAPVLTAFALRRAPRLAALGGALGAYGLAVALSDRGGARRRSRAPRTDRTPGGSVHLVSANLLLTNPSIEVAAEHLRTGRSDVLALQELTPGHLAALRRTRLLDHLPHEVVSPEPGYHGAGLFSRWPLRDAVVVDLDGVPFPAATVDTPAGALRVVVVHAKNPGARGELRRWQRQLAGLSALAAEAAASGLPLVLVGDYNATDDHRDFRRLATGSLRDAWREAGRGLGATWPVWRGPVPPVLRLDHALVSPRVVVQRVTTHVLPGSDHRHLRLTLGLRAG